MFDPDEHNRSSNDSLDPNNLSIGNSEVSLSGLDRSVSYHSGEEVNFLAMNPSHC
jgi:hypothetical protein